jgi:hypothetical protein
MYESCENVESSAASASVDVCLSSAYTYESDSLNTNGENSIAQLNALNDFESTMFIPVKKTERRIGYVHHPQLL